MNQSFAKGQPTRNLSAAVAVALLLAAPPLAHSQSGGSPNERFGESTDVILVQIPIHVTRNGEPVRGLTASNFEILEGRKKQSVVAVDVFDLSMIPSSENAASRAASVPPAGRRNFVMLFDLSNSLPAGIVRAREAALDLAYNGLHPSDLAAVATYSQSRGIELLMGFSTDRAQLEAALNDLGLVDPFERLNDPLRLRVVELQNDFAMSKDAEASFRGLAFNDELRSSLLAFMMEQLKDLSVLNSRSNRDQIKQQIIDLSGNLDALAQLLDSASGRKQIVLFSQGFDSEVVFGTQDAGRIQEIMQAVEFGQTWRVDSEERFGATDAQGSLLSMLEQFNRSDCAVHTVDVGGLAAGGSAAVLRAGGQDFGGDGALDRGHDGLALMANETGGQFYRNFNDLSDAMSDLLERTSVTYVVSIEPRDLVLDGSYHPLKVRLKGIDKGTKLSHRPGYYARRPYSELDPMERQLVTAEQLVAGAPGGQIGTKLLAAAFPSANEEAYVLTAIEIDGSTLTAGQPDNVVPAEIYTYAFDERGHIRDYFSQAVMMDLYKVGYRLDTGFKLISHLQLPEGRYEIRSLVRNVHTGSSGLSVTTVEVPSFSGDGPVLLPPFFIEPDDHWLVGHEQREGSEARYPLMGADKPLIPASHPRLVANQQIPVLLVGHELPRTLEADGRLIGSDGKVYDKIDIDVERRLADRGDGERLISMLYAPSIKPGEYRLVVTVRGDGEETSSSVPVTFLPIQQ